MRLLYVSVIAGFMVLMGCRGVLPVIEVPEMQGPGVGGKYGTYNIQAGDFATEADQYNRYSEFVRRYLGKRLSEITLEHASQGKVKSGKALLIEGDLAFSHGEFDNGKSTVRVNVRFRVVDRATRKTLYVTTLSHFLRDLGQVEQSLKKGVDSLGVCRKLFPK